MLPLLYSCKSKCYAYIFSYALIRGWHNQTLFDLHGKSFFQMNRLQRLQSIMFKKKIQHHVDLSTLAARQ